MMIQPQEVVIDNKTFVLSKFPAVAGREIIMNYHTSAIPKIGDYKTNETIMLKIMSYVGIKIEGMPQPLQLTTQALVDNHTGDWETLAKIELAMMEYNCSFFRSGRISLFLDDIAQKLPMWISKTLTLLSQQSLQTEKPPSTN